MVTQQKVFIKKDGTIEGLQVKKGKGIDLRQFGKAKIERASEIVWNEKLQKWFIKVLVGRFKNRVLTTGMFSTYTKSNDISSLVDKEMYFEDYEDAVKKEIAFLDSVRTIFGSL